MPIADLLGPDGHLFCAGYRLDPVGGDLNAAQDCRKAWVDAQRNDREPDVPEPRCTEIESFEGGTFQFSFQARADRSGYEIATLYAEPST